MDQPFDKSLLSDPTTGARRLIGANLIRELGDGTYIKARIVETEAYHQGDPASHTFKGEGGRNTVMFGPAGYAYVYLSYGMHWCINVTAGKEGYGAGILIRAVEPLEGIDCIRNLRGGITKDILLTNGPGKVGQAMAIDKSLYGHDLSKLPLKLESGVSVEDSDIVIATRIGISQAADELLRFYLKDSPYVSRK